MKGGEQQPESEASPLGGRRPTIGRVSLTRGSAAAAAAAAATAAAAVAAASVQQNRIKAE